ncbi:MAG: hypothetical protein QOH16_711 [Gaiellaceae bacterium]|nr:hypothetical protein [Gaiellaceae bacterium]
MAANVRGARAFVETLGVAGLRRPTRLAPFKNPVLALPELVDDWQVLDPDPGLGEMLVQIWSHLLAVADDPREQVVASRLEFQDFDLTDVNRGYFDTDAYRRGRSPGAPANRYRLAYFIRHADVPRVPVVIAVGAKGLQSEFYGLVARRLCRIEGFAITSYTEPYGTRVRFMSGDREAFVEEFGLELDEEADVEDAATYQSQVPPSDRRPVAMTLHTLQATKTGRWTDELLIGWDQAGARRGVGDLLEVRDWLEERRIVYEWEDPFVDLAG